MDQRLTAAFVLSLACAPVLAQGERFNGDGWSFVPPEGWTEIGPEHLELMNALLQQTVLDERQRYITGFADPGIWPDGEYMLVQLNDNAFRGITEDQLVAAFNAIEGTDLDEHVPGETPDMIQDARIDTIVYDDERKRIVMRSRSTVDGQPQESYSVVHPGKNRGIHLNWYAPAEEYDASLPTFIASTDTFMWDAGEAWTPRMSTGNKIILYAVIGALAGGIMPLIKSIATKKSKPEPA